MPASLRQDTVSKFFATSVAQLCLGPDTRILDIPCGFGRHARWLASSGAQVIGLDIDERRISQARTLSKAHAAQIVWAVADAERSLPVRDGSFDVIVIVHYVTDRIIDMACRVLKPGGHLIFETFDARGENWRDLPFIGAIPAALANGFETIDLHERAVGPDNSRAVVRALARMLPQNRLTQPEPLLSERANSIGR